jgi:hypothetical protein
MQQLEGCVVAATAEREISRRMAADRPSEAAFVAISALLFAGSTTLTIVWCASMSAMGMSMPGGWTMSMAWMRMPGQTWPGAADDDGDDAAVPGSHAAAVPPGRR